MTNTQVILTKRPTGIPTPVHFDVVTAPIPTPDPGQVLIGRLPMTKIVFRAETCFDLKSIGNESGD